MQGDHESRLSKVEQRTDHNDEAIRALGSMVQDHAALKERVETNTRDIDRVGEKVRVTGREQDDAREALERELRAEIKDVRDEVEEGRSERKSDRRYGLATAFTIATALIALTGLIVVILQFLGVGHG